MPKRCWAHSTTEDEAAAQTSAVAEDIIFEESKLPATKSVKPGSVKASNCGCATEGDCKVNKAIADSMS